MVLEGNKKKKGKITQNTKRFFLVKENFLNEKKNELLLLFFFCFFHFPAVESTDTDFTRPLLPY